MSVCEDCNKKVCSSADGTYFIFCDTHWPGGIMLFDSTSVGLKKNTDTTLKVENRYSFKSIKTPLKICSVIECNTVASFGEKGTKNLKYCKIHAPKGYACNRVKLCAAFGCLKTPGFVKKDGPPHRYCKTHAPKGYVNVKRVCATKGCYKAAKFSDAYTEKPKFCNVHAPDGYMNVKKFNKSIVPVTASDTE